MRFYPGCNCCGGVACCGCPATPLVWSAEIPGERATIVTPCNPGEPAAFVCDEYTGTYLLTYTEDPAFDPFEDALCYWVGESTGSFGYRWLLHCIPTGIGSLVQFRLSMIRANGSVSPSLCAGFAFRSASFTPGGFPCLGPIEMPESTGPFAGCPNVGATAVLTAA
jgi:hypothetical protein